MDLQDVLYCEVSRRRLLCRLYSTQRPPKRVPILWDGSAPAPSKNQDFPVLQQ